MAHLPTPQNPHPGGPGDPGGPAKPIRRLEAQLEAQLEAHRSFLERLARSLVGDAALADDLVQETALAALQQGTRMEQSRGWLARVLRRKVSRHRERTGLRESRQRSAASPESVASHAAAIDRRLDLEHVLTDRLRALPIAQARAIGLRYAEGMAIPEIARALGVPEATIKTRLKRGLARLREDLDRAHGGDGKQWLSAIAPMAGTASKWAAPALATGGATKAGTAQSAAKGAAAWGGLAPWVTCTFLLGGLAAMTALLLPSSQSPNAADPIAAAADLSGRMTGPGEATSQPENQTHLQAPTESPQTEAPPPRRESRTALASTTSPPPTARQEPRPRVLYDGDIVKKQRVHSMEMEDYAPYCILDLKLRDGIGTGLCGHATFRARGLKDRSLEFRGKASAHALKLRVPADALIEMTARYDGYEPVQASFRAGPSGSTLEKIIELLPTLDSAELTLLLPPLPDGSDYPDGVQYYVLIEGPRSSELAMPMRTMSSRSSSLSVGRIPAGQVHVRGYTTYQFKISLNGQPTGYKRVFEVDLSLAPGERRSVPIEAMKCGTVRLDVTNPKGRSIPASFYITRNGRPGRLTPGVSRVGKVSSASQLDGKGRMVLRGVRCVPGPIQLHVESPGFEPRTADVTLRSGEMLDVVIQLDPASD